MISDAELDAIMTIMTDAFDPHWREAWTRRQVAASLATSNTYHDLALRDGAPAGFTLVRAAPGEEELLLIGVRPAMRRTGVGRELVQDAIASARARGADRLFLEMRVNNPAAQLYRAMDFKTIGRRTRYYTLANGERLDAITYAREL
ncbi:MAG: GNAT family N-acetyltransferase [Parerythrobacter sp.]